MKRLFLIVAGLTALFLAYATYLALKVAPADALQGDVYRIIYYHVPSAWTAFLLFFINFIASFQYLARTKASLQKAVQWVVIAIGVIGVIATFLPQVQALLPTGMRPSPVARTVLAIPASKSDWTANALMLVTSQRCATMVICRTSTSAAIRMIIRSPNCGSSQKAMSLSPAPKEKRRDQGERAQHRACRTTSRRARPPGLP